MKKRFGAVLIIMGLMLNIAGTSIYAANEISIENQFSTGIVDIELEEYTLEDGEEILWTDKFQNIVPGQTISKIPRIYNSGNDCYVRADVEFVGIFLTEDVLYGMSDDWILAPDGYYYYKNSLLCGDSVDIFQGFKVPVDLSEEFQDTEFSIIVSVEAIQCENFIPDFEIYDPWHEVEIQACMKEGMYDIESFKTSQNLNFEIRYVGETERLYVNTEDFFENFPVLLPGNVYEDTLEFTNQSEDDVNLYFRSSVPKGTKLMDKITLKISKTFNGGESIIFDDTIRASELSRNLLLATVKAGESGRLDYKISVPKTLDNEYTIMEDSVVWIFSTIPIQDVEAVPTGDDKGLQWYQVIFVGSTLLMIGFGILIYEKVRENICNAE